MIWLRSNNGMLFGVCAGLAKVFHIPVGVLRLVWVLSILCFGFGFGVYFLLALSLPREDEYWRAYDRRILGVCSRIARKIDLEVGLVRFLALCSIFVSFGATIIVYLVLNFVLSDEPTNSQI